MAGVFFLMALGLFFLPSGIFEGWTTSSRVTMGAAILLYAGFRVFRARKMLKNLQEKNRAHPGSIEKDE